MRFLITTLILLLPLPAFAGIPWHLTRDNGRLGLLSPAPLVHVSLKPDYWWEGTASTFEAEYRGRELLLTIHRDRYQTSYWYDLRIIQKPSGEILATWCSTRDGDDTFFARYPDFPTAWRDGRFRRSLQPALCQMRQFLPTTDEAWEMIDLGL